MSGTVEGGKAAAITNRERYGDGSNGKADYYRSIGKIGGRLSRGGGFSLTGNPAIDEKRLELARAAGRKGGQISTRSGKKDAAMSEWYRAYRATKGLPEIKPEA